MYGWYRGTQLEKGVQGKAVHVSVGDVWLVQGGLSWRRVFKVRLYIYGWEDDQFMVHSRQESDTEYLVDMSLATCSCPAGRDGSPCSHQHAVVLHFQKASLNYIPTMHPAARQQLAYIALGEKAEKSLQFYASIGQKHDEEQNPNALEDTVGGLDFSAPCWSTIRDGGKDEVEESEDAKDNQLQKLSTELDEVVADLKQQIQCDPQLASGVLKFTDRYFKMRRNRTHTLLVSAFHRFGWNYGGGTVASGKGGILRRGKRIPIQVTAAGRRKGKFRGKAPAVPGRPPKGLTHTTTSTEPSRYNFMLTRRPPKGKRQHNLALNIKIGQQNAGKW